MTTWPPWLFMWALAALVFAGCKLLTFVYCERGGVSRPRQAAYLFAWPGLDADGFLRRMPNRPPRLFEWGLASAQMVLGAGLIWLLAPRIPRDAELERGWVGMVGIILFLHFGCFLLLSCLWRSVGYEAKPLMDWPALSVSVSDFWSRRWNSAFRDFNYRFVYRPVTGSVGPRWAVLISFLASGLIHDLVISVPAGGGYGLPTLYFLLQAAALLVERSWIGKMLKLERGTIARMWSLFVVAGPAYILFHPPFVTRVIVPFLEFLGAS